MALARVPDQINFFVAGSERSGTTVTGTLLDQMPEVCNMQATMVMTRLSNMFTMIKNVLEQGGEIDGVDPIVCGSLTDFVNCVTVTPFLHKTLFHICYYENLVNSARADVTKDVLAQKAYVEGFDFNRYMQRYEDGDRTWKTTITALYSEFAASNPGRYRLFGEQTPDNALYIDTMKSLFPDSKVIFMVRHPVTCVASLMDRYGSVDEATLLYRNPFAHYPFNNEAVMEQTLFVKFEDLLMHQDRTLNLMREFLGLKPLKASKLNKKHASKMFSKYVGNSLSTDRYFRSLAKIPPETRRLIFQKNDDIAKVFYSEDETADIIGYQEAA